MHEEKSHARALAGLAWRALQVLGAIIVGVPGFALGIQWLREKGGVMTLSSGWIVLALIFLWLWAFISPWLIWLGARAWWLDRQDEQQRKFDGSVTAINKAFDDAVKQFNTQVMTRDKEFEDRVKQFLRQTYDEQEHAH